MNQTERLIRHILESGQATTQGDILQALAKEGVSCSQPKVSRLLHQLGAVKVVDEKGKTQYRLPHESGLLHELSSPQEKALLSQWVLSISHNEQLIVIHTRPGAAGMVARIIDQQRLTLDILGTIAGDDTIFISPKSLSSIKQCLEAISKLLHL